MKFKKQNNKENETVSDEGVREEEVKETVNATKKEKEKKEEAPDYYNQLLTLKADFENFRKRTEKEKPELIKWGKAGILLKLLPLYDLLMKAHDHISNEDIAEAGGDKGGVKEIMVGLEMIFKEFKKVFEAEGIRPMEVVGKPYDPMQCEIMGVVDGDEENDGLVVEELQKGFYLEDKVLRPSCVKIAKKKTEVESKESKK